MSDYAWWGGFHQGNCRNEEHAHQVGRKRPNAFGLYDMHGNVWEWCLDGYDENFYRASGVDDPLREADGLSRVYRGGSWRCPRPYCRSAYRDWNTPRYRSSGVGFRLTLVP